EQFGDVEISLQLQMRPMVERVTQRIRDGSRPGKIFLMRSGIAGAISLRNAVGAHRPPFVVVSLKPYFEEVGKSPILGNVLGKKMTVIVEDGLRSSKPMVEAPRRLIRKEEVFGEKTFHARMIQGKNHIRSRTQSIALTES